MLKKSNAVKAGLDGPFTLGDVLEWLDALRDGESVSEAQWKSFRSTAFDCARELVRVETGTLPDRSEVLSVDISRALPVFHGLAARAARRKGHRTASDHAGRAARLVALLTGKRFDRAVRGVPMPEPWKPVADALPTRVRSRILFLAEVVLMTGSRSPEIIPSWEKLLEQAILLLHGDAERAKQRLTASTSMYRKARGELLKGVRSETEHRELERRYAPLPRRKRPNLSHASSEPWAQERLLELGHRPDEMDSWEILRALAPGFAADFEWWNKHGAGARLRPKTREADRDVLQRVAGWIIRADHAEDLHRLTLLDLVVETVVLEEPVEEVNPRIARLNGGSVTRTVSLLEYAARIEAEPSLQRSPVLGQLPEGRAPGGGPWVTDTLRNDCWRVWSIVKGVYSDMVGRGDEEKKLWAQARVGWESLELVLKAGKLDACMQEFAKDKAALIRTITYPQLTCLALPIRQRELHRLRERWQIAKRVARSKGQGFDHPEVRKRERAYFDQLLPHFAFMLPLEDGMRMKNYTHGRPGHHFKVVLSEDEPARLLSLETNWTGRRDDRASGKIGTKGNQIYRRMGRLVRPGMIDLVLLGDLLLHERPSALVRAGRIASFDEDSVRADLLDSPFALFATPSPINRREDASRSDLSIKAGEELHRLIQILRPEIGTYEDLKSDPAWRGIMSGHVTRLLITSYWGGIRGRWDRAEYLTADTEVTLKEAYSEVAHDLNDRLADNPTHWEHPRAFDAHVDKLYRRRQKKEQAGEGVDERDGGEEDLEAHDGDRENVEEQDGNVEVEEVVHDPLSDPALPMPPGLRERIEEEERRWKKERASLPGKLKIRQARPGQAPPQTDDVGTGVGHQPTKKRSA